MARSFYRFYLYTVYIALLVFITVATSRLLEVLLSLTSLRPAYVQVPQGREVAQAWVFAVVSWVIGGGLAGLHYWLIRRDIRREPEAGESAIRSFFLNMTEAIALVIAIYVIGFVLINGLGVYGVVPAAASSLPLLGLAVWLERDRRKSQFRAGGALAFQRLHLYGVHCIVLLFFASYWLAEGKLLIGEAIFGNAICNANEYYCLNAHLWNISGSLLWLLLCWIGYVLLTCTDRGRLSRFLWHGLGLAAGLGLLLVGLYSLVQFLLVFIAGQAALPRDVFGPGALYDFAPPLILGLLVAVVYHLCLRRATRQGIIEVLVLRLSEIAILTILLGFVFWAGCYQFLSNLFQMLMASSPDFKTWTVAYSLLIVGLGYPPLHLSLRRRYLVHTEAEPGPYRGFVLALLAAGILALAIGGATALYAWGSSLLGSPLSNGTQLLSSGLAAVIVGAGLIALYLRTALNERLFALRTTPSVSTPASTAVERADVVEPIIDDLLAGRITREEAISRLRHPASTQE